MADNIPPSPSITAYNSPFGTFPKDLTWDSLHRSDPATERLNLKSGRTVFRCPQAGVISKEFSEITLEAIRIASAIDGERIWNMMHLAGDCCVALVGRVFHNSAVIGFCMPIETPIDAARISTIEERIRIIHKLKHLVATLHSRNIVHGDIKPENLLVCADGSLRLCDFDGASVEGDGYATAVLSLPYCSPSRFQGNGPAVPMTRAEDIYAMGMTMWEIYTGRTPLIDIGESFTTEELIDCLEHRVNAGFLPDMQLIDDLEIAALIQECLDAAPECSDGIVQDKIYCIATWFAFGHCKVQPRHSYSRTVHSWQCHQAWPDHDKDVPCADFFLQPKILTGREEPTCPKCVKSVVFAGLAG